MKGKRWVWLALAALLLVTGIAGAVYLHSRPNIPEGTIQIEWQGGQTALAIGGLPMVSVQGTVVNGKGEERTVDGQGILLREALAGVGVDNYFSATVTADDAYSAQVTAEEIAASDKVYLLQDEGEVRLVVFDDENSKRNVSHVVRITVS